MAVLLPSGDAGNGVDCAEQLEIVMIRALALAFLLAAFCNSVAAGELEDLKAMAESGNAVAQAGLALKYANGTGVPQDDKQAIHWYTLSAEQGFAMSQTNLGAKYDRGQGVPEDDKQAVHWYTLAAEQGDVNGQINLGMK